MATNDHDDNPRHDHGTMDVTEHQKTFEGFLTFVKWSIVVIAAVLVFLALVNA